MFYSNIYRYQTLEPVNFWYQLHATLTSLLVPVSGQSVIPFKPNWIGLKKGLRKLILDRVMLQWVAYTFRQAGEMPTTRDAGPIMDQVRKMSIVVLCIKSIYYFVLLLMGSSHMASLYRCYVVVKAIINRQHTKNSVETLYHSLLRCNELYT